MEDEYYTQCGELYLTINGNIAIHCMLCENIYKSFKEYANHTRLHYKEFAKRDISSDTKQNHNTNVENGHTITSDFHTTDESSPSAIVKNEADIEFLSPTHFENQKNITQLRSKTLKSGNKERKFKCSYCEYACSDKSNMKQHARRHYMEKQHKCSECTKTFHTRTELNIHMRCHTGEKPYVCTECGFAFSTSSKLSLHRKRHYNIKDKICTICNYACYDSNSLRNHLAIHSEERKYKCTQCKSSFKARVSLANHIKIHENKKEFACKLCDSKFNQQAGLYSHMKSFHTVVV